MDASATLANDLATMFITAAVHDDEDLIQELYNDLDGDDQVLLTIGLLNAARGILEAVAASNGESTVAFWQGIILAGLA